MEAVVTGPPKREQQPHMFMVQNSTNSRPGVNQAALAGSPELPVPSEGLAIDLLLSLSQLRVQPCSWPPAQRGSADNHPGWIMGGLLGTTASNAGCLRRDRPFLSLDRGPRLLRKLPGSLGDLLQSTQ